MMNIFKYKKIIEIFVILHGTLILTFSIKECGYIKELKERKQYKE